MPIRNFEGDKLGLPPLASFGAVPLRIHQSGDLRHYESLYIIHHPLGQPKKLTFYKCFYSTLCAVRESEFGHTCDTENGSSGALIFVDDPPQIIGIQKEGGLNRDQDSCNRGVRIESIISKSKLLKQLVSNAELPASEPAPPVATSNDDSFRAISSLRSDHPIRQAASSVVFIVVRTSSGKTVTGCSGVHVGNRKILTSAHCVPSWLKQDELKFTIAFGDEIGGFGHTRSGITVDIGVAEAFPGRILEVVRGQDVAVLYVETERNLSQVYGFHDLAGARDLLPQQGVGIFATSDISRMIEYERAVAEPLYSIFFLPNGKKVLTTRFCSGYIASLPLPFPPLADGPLVLHNCSMPSGSSGALFYSLNSDVPIGINHGSIQNWDKLKYRYTAIPISSMITSSEVLRKHLLQTWQSAVEITYLYEAGSTRIKSAMPETLDRMLFTARESPDGPDLKFHMPTIFGERIARTTIRGIPLPVGLPTILAQKDESIRPGDLYKVRILSYPEDGVTEDVKRERVELIRSMLHNAGLDNLIESGGAAPPSPSARPPEGNERDTAEGRVKLVIDVSGLFLALRSSTREWLSDRSGAERQPTSDTKETTK